MAKYLKVLLLLKFLLSILVDLIEMHKSIFDWWFLLLEYVVTWILLAVLFLALLHLFLFASIPLLLVLHLVGSIGTVIV